MRFLLLILGFSFMIIANAQQPVSPQSDTNGNLFFQVGNVYFEVNPDHGSRIVSFKLDETEFLWTSNLVPDMFGSTAWLSPQDLWGWPPQPQIDTNPYSGGISGNRIVLTSAQASANNSVKFQMRKKFSADLQDTSISISYTIINKSTVAKSFAAWEIMRVPTGGISLFPVNGDITGDLADFFHVENSIAWWDYDSTENNRNKAFADGNLGWTAHIENNRLIHIKQFTDLPSNFPSNKEMEIEYYASPNSNYIEIEKHSDYRQIPVNDSITLSMKWFLRKLPEDISLTENNPDIIKYINSVLASSVNNIKHVKGQDAILIYPNPSPGDIEISGIPAGESLQFTLINVLGETMISRYVTNGDRIELKFLKNGIYLYKLSSRNYINMGKLILKK